MSSTFDSGEIRLETMENSTFRRLRVILGMEDYSKIEPLLVEYLVDCPEDIAQIPRAKFYSIPGVSALSLRDLFNFAERVECNHHSTPIPTPSIL